MPYRRLPKTDSARIKALKTLLDNNDIYTARGRFISWDSISRAQPACDRLLTATQQYGVTLQAQTRHTRKLAKLQRSATMYVSHFLQVLLMSVERGEIKASQLELYGLNGDVRVLPNIKTIEGLIEWGRKTIDGEKARLKKGGRPIYNPTLAMVETHYDLFVAANDQQRLQLERTRQAHDTLVRLRPEVDEILLDLWNQIEVHFADEPWKERVEHCSKYGVVYYNRKGEGKESEK